MRTLSIIVPVYGEEQNLPTAVSRLLSLRSGLPGYEVEIVFVDDGSRDRSLELLLGYQQQNPSNIVIVKLARNFGSMAAVGAGLSVARGDCVGMIGSDLQDPPELFLDMIPYCERGIKAVFAVRHEREEPWSRTFFSRLYYALLRRFAIRDYPQGGFDVFLIDRQVVDEVNRIGEKNTNIMSLIFWLGFQYVTVPYLRKDRIAGESKWSTAKKFKLFIDSFAAFSYAPIRMVWILGLVFALLAMLYGGKLLLEGSISGDASRAWAAVAVLIVFTTGLQMTVLGVVGEYVWRTLDETRRRPQYIIERVFRA